MFFKRKCKHHVWDITEKSNVIQYVDMGYPLMLFIQKCRNCGITEQVWLDVPESWIDKLKTGELVLLKWEKFR